MRNYVVNSRYGQAPPGPVHIRNGGAWVANKFWCGSGVGGACTVTRQPFMVGQTDVPGNPEWFMRAAWSAAPTDGEAQYKPHIRWTWFEHHIYGARELVGETLHFDGWLRVASGDVWVVPVAWINYADGDYQIVELPGVTVTTTWTHLSGSATLPPYPLGKVLDSGHYVGIGYDFVYQTAPTIDVAPMRAWTDAAIDTEHYWFDAQLSLQP